MAVMKFCYNDSQTAEFLTFKPDEQLEFKIEDAWESKAGEALMLVCRVLAGEQKGDLTMIKLGYEISTGAANFATKDFLKLFFSAAERRQGMDNKKLLGRKFSCISKVKPNGERTFQNYAYFKLIAEEGGY